MYIIEPEVVILFRFIMRLSLKLHIANPIFTSALWVLPKHGSMFHGQSIKSIRSLYSTYQLAIFPCI